MIMKTSIPVRADTLKRLLLKRPQSFQIRQCAKKIEDNADQPVKFFGGEAAKRAVVAPIRKEIHITMPWYQPYSVCGSIALFLIYFCILREENDVDIEFNKTLYDRIKGLEKQQLLLSYQYNKENGLSTKEIEARLNDIEAEESVTPAGNQKHLN